MPDTNYLLMTPGPVQIPPAVAQAMAEPMIHHRTPEFEKILESVLSRLPTVFKTSERVAIQVATGSGGLESSIVNTLSPGDTALCVVVGKFGERWRTMCEVYGINVISYDVPWGESAQPKRIAELLKANPQTKAVLVQACETSTGVVNPIREIATLTRDLPNTILMVDAITACGVVDLAMDDWGLDVVIAASQKAFMLPTGLAFLAFSKKAQRFVEAAKCPRFYWDVRAEFQTNKKNQTHFSSAVSLIKGLSIVLDILLAKGVDQNVRDCARMAAGVRAGAEALGFRIYSQSPSPSVTPLLVPSGFEGEKIQTHLEKKYRVTISGGQDQLKGKVIRIGTMGFITDQDVVRTMGDLARTMNDLRTSGQAEFDIEKIKGTVSLAMKAFT